ncbi:hypothetical protein [Bifidobacterium myosotis]|uniref:Uncharacterized protein n=1 Tax=Bifidobacterium myosotis TaxID=1630166 RepID=A0A5M9ZKP2_9BIFI|nr:hypothetical protein [Bifidobacterium myosotis]KAA8828160.1 hypothetical protein EMO91_06890 [Bifidobacterium myosotis]
MVLDANGRSHRPQGLPAGVAGTFDGGGRTASADDLTPPPAPADAWHVEPLKTAGAVGPYGAASSTGFRLTRADGTTITVRDAAGDDSDAGFYETRHVSVGTPTVSIRLDMDGRPDVDADRLARIAADLEAYRIRANRETPRYGAPIERFEAAGADPGRLTVRPVHGTPPARPAAPWKWADWNRAREAERRAAADGFEYAHD